MTGRDYIKEELMNAEVEKKKTDKNYDIKKSLSLSLGTLTGILGVLLAFGLPTLTIPLLSISAGSFLSYKKYKEMEKTKLASIAKEEEHLQGILQNGIDGSNNANRKRRKKIERIEELKEENNKGYQKSKVLSYLFNLILLGTASLSVLLQGITFALPFIFVIAKALNDDEIVRGFRKRTSYERQEKLTEQELELLSRIHASKNVRRRSLSQRRDAKEEGKLLEKRKEEPQVPISIIEEKPKQKVKRIEPSRS